MGEGGELCRLDESKNNIKTDQKMSRLDWESSAESSIILDRQYDVSLAISSNLRR